MNLGRGSERTGRGEVLVQTGYPAPTLVEKGKMTNVVRTSVTNRSFCFGGQSYWVWAGLDLLRSHRERCLKITKLGPTQICSLVVCSLLQQTVHDHSTSVDAHGAGASTVPCNSLAVVNLRPCLVKNSLVPTCLVPGTKHGLEVIKWHAKRPCYP